MDITPDMRKKIRYEYSYWKPRTSPYQYGDWKKYFSPIETILWDDLRSQGMTFYPQFPIGPYFLDFADPERKLCVEADGREFHQDYHKDMERDRELLKLGWTTIRISGRDIKEGLKSRMYINSMKRIKYFPHSPPEEPLEDPEFI